MANLRVVVADAEPAAPQAPLITLPIVLIALLKFSNFGVRLNKARNGASIWYFRFHPSALLEVREDGAWCWRKGSPYWRRQIEPFLLRAETLLAEHSPGGAGTRRAIGSACASDRVSQPSRVVTRV